MTARPDSPRQIPLPIKSLDRYDFVSFQPGENREVLTALYAVVHGDSVANVYIWGNKGTGKSHLLQAVCSVTNDLGKKSVYIPLAEDDLAPEILNGLASMDIVCIDDLDRIAGSNDWEQKLFALFNEMRDLKKPLLFAANSSPKGLRLNLPDLETRLSWDLVYRLQAIDEQTLVIALQHRARSKMFDLPDEVIEYLIRRVSRDTHTLFSILDKLDKASLQSKRKLTVPFVKEHLGI